MENARYYELFSQYLNIMRKEIKLRQNHNFARYVIGQDGQADDPTKIYQMACRILDVAESEFVSRGYNISYNLSKADVYESVAAHTELTATILTYALDFCYGGNFGWKEKSWTNDGYYYREIMEAVRVHDLPENETGDIADNLSRDEDKKRRHERGYYKRFFDNSPLDPEMKERVLKLLREMEEKSSPTGRLIYLSDKTAALVVTLYLDSVNKPPVISKFSPYASEHDRREMEMCDKPYDRNRYKASEMWSVDFFNLRNTVELDNNFFFTAIIVMITLMVNRQWYAWREAKYI